MNMQTVIVLAVVAAGLFAAWKFGFAHFGKCECGTAEALEAIKREIAKHTQPNELDELAAHLDKLLAIRQAKSKPPA